MESSLFLPEYANQRYLQVLARVEFSKAETEQSKIGYKRVLLEVQGIVLNEDIGKKLS